MAFYLLVILALGQLDRADTPIINFASYFYASAILVVPIMIFIPSLHKTPVYVPAIFWGAIYLVLLRVIDRTRTSTSNVEIILLEFILLEGGVWISYQLAVAIDQSESLMDVLAQGTFPNRTIELDAASDRIKTEFSRSRRYHRPVSLLVIDIRSQVDSIEKDVLKSLQRDMLARLSSARVGQAVGEAIRQTDLLMRDHGGRFIVLCPETPLDSASLLAERIRVMLEERTGMLVTYGVASFPDEALNFEDLLYTARDRSKKVKPNSLIERAKEQISNNDQ